MATIKRFSDTDNGAIELVTLTTMDNKEFATRFPGIKGMRSDGYAMWVGRPAGVASRFVGDTAGLLPVTRAIEYKSQPSKHVCNAKCLAGKHNGTCECQCGGKNHGAGMFTKMLEAA